ncbi:MAG TPA: DUF1697 domain-containing protein [Chthoniobacterales bacterium]|jgi:uncharacterized protein (DUF1697 family)|nr:DUF1697 domain-containing protein [Chthoniobacterales bacterium]
MQRYAAFLRGINLGRRRLPMSRLKALFEELGFADVATFIASGNVIFSSEMKDRRELEMLIARHLERSLGYRVDTFVRTTDEVAEIARMKTFPEEGQEQITVHVGFLHEALTPEIARKLAAVRTPTDEFRVRGREFYWLTRVRVSDSKVWSSPAIKALRLPTSSLRNMTSLRKLFAKHIA